MNEVNETSPANKVSDVERLVILRQIKDAGLKFDKYRSCGFLNHDYDMARISIHLPINEARKLLAAIKAI
jgi:hypothetical protein